MTVIVLATFKMANVVHVRHWMGFRRFRPMLASLACCMGGVMIYAEAEMGLGTLVRAILMVKPAHDTVPIEHPDMLDIEYPVVG